MPTLFKPTRASPRPRQARAVHASSAPPSIDLSVVSSSTVVVPELRNLSRDDIDFLESVVKRAGPIASTFPVVFKAYNDVLKERGMDTGEIRYYGKILKLGTMKGKNWGEKWDAVKRQHSQEVDLSENDCETVSTRVKPCLGPVYMQPSLSLPKLQDIDAETAPSGTEDNDAPVDSPQYHQTANYTSSKLRSATRKLSGAQNARNKVSTTSCLPGSNPAFRNRPPTNDASGSEAETIAPSSPVTPDDLFFKGSHHIQTLHPTSRASTHSLDFSRPTTSRNRFSDVRQSVIRSRSRDAIDEGDAWNKIRMQQLEAEADRFREERLLERCWVVWRESYLWIMASQKQIDQARNTFLLKLTFHHWRSSLASRRAIYKDVTVLDNERRLCAFLMLWRRRLREKQQARWRFDMRSKMKIIKDRQNTRMFREAWTLWGQNYQLAIAGHDYHKKVVLTAFLKWKDLFRRVDEIEKKAEKLVSLRDQRLLEKYWRHWRIVNGISGAEKKMVNRVNARIVWQAWLAWKQYTHDKRRAKFFRDRIIQKRALERWKIAVEKVHALEARADKHSARQDKILACAVLRVWLAHVRGREVDRQRGRKLLYRALLTWKKQLAQNRLLEGHGTVFYQKTSTRVLTTALFRWQAVHHARCSVYDSATRFYDDHLVNKFGSFWLLQFRERTEERKQQKLVKKLQDRQAARVLYRWLLLTRKKRRCAQAEAVLQERVCQRIGHNVLARWTQRVIFMRERELNAIEIYSGRVLTNAWTRMQSFHAQHRENLKLLEDHLASRKEDTLSRFFRRWLATTRVTQHRRYTLQNKEDEIKQMVLQEVWEQWRSTYLERRLRPLEIEMLMRSQQNLMYQALSVWYKKARARPAIVAVKFNAQRTKKMFYLKWREALPIAQKVRKVRENRDRLLLSRIIKHWSEAYRTKLVLKAVARARHLRLPTNRTRAINGPFPTAGSPSSSASPPHGFAPTKLDRNRSGNHVPRRATMQVPSNEEPIMNDKEALRDDDLASRQRSSRLSRSPFGLGNGTGIVSLLRTNVHQNQQEKSDLSPPRPRSCFSNVVIRRKSSTTGVDSRDVGGFSLFASANAESTPPNRRTRSTGSDDAGGRRVLWNRLSTDRRIREPSPSMTSQFTESLSSSP